MSYGTCFDVLYLCKDIVLRYTIWNSVSIYFNCFQANVINQDDRSDADLKKNTQLCSVSLVNTLSYFNILRS